MIRLIRPATAPRDRAARTAAFIRVRRAMGLAQRRRAMPRALPPTTIEREYAARLVAIAERIRPAYRELLDALPRLLADAEADRRHDVGEGRRVRELVERARRAAEQAIGPDDLERLAAQFAERTATHQRIQLDRQTRAALGADAFVTDKYLPAMVDGFAQENVALIKGVFGDTATAIEKATTRAIQGATLHEDLAKELNDKFDFGITRAKLIARDQVGKLYAQIGRARHQELGVSSYVWRTVGDQRVRDEHVAREGEVFKYSDPPEDGHPGVAVLCRCYEEPIFDEIQEEAGIEPTDRSEPEVREADPVEESARPAFVDDIPDSPLAPRQQQALYDYQGGRYVAINSYARTGDLGEGSLLGSKKEADAALRDLDRAITGGSLPRDAVLYRGASGLRVGDLEVGSTFVENGYSSTSLSRAVGEQFAGDKRNPVLLEVVAPKGTPAAFVPGAGGLDEAEVLLARKTKYEVLSVTEREVGGRAVRVARVRVVRGA